MPAQDRSFHLDGQQYLQRVDSAEGRRVRDVQATRTNNDDRDTANSFWNSVSAAG